MITPKLFILALYFCQNPTCHAVIVTNEQPPAVIQECRRRGRMATHRHKNRAWRYFCVPMPGNERHMPDLTNKKD